MFDRFREAAEATELWTTSPERSRRFWHDVYGIFLRELGIPDANGLIDVVYAEFTDPGNYRLFDDVTPVLDGCATPACCSAWCRTSRSGSSGSSRISASVGTSR